MNKTIRRLFLYFLLIFIAFIMIFPFFWMLSTSLKTEKEVLLYPPTFWPRQISVQNYLIIALEADFPRYLINSLFIVGISTSIAIFTSCICGYIFAKFKFPGNNLLFILILATTMIPFQTYMVPFYLMMKNLQLINTYFGIMLPLFVTSFGIFFIKQNALSIPDELIDAARIDGGTEWSIFLRLILRLLKAPIAAIGIFTFMFGWKFFIWPLIMTNSPKKFVLELGLTQLANRNAMDYGLQMTGAIFAIIPILITYLILRRRFVSGIILTGIKG